MELLYIIRNSERNNHSILGVYNSAKEAKKAIEYNERRLLEGGYVKHGTVTPREAREKEIDFIPYKEVKVVPLNGIQYRGCSAYSVEQLLSDPEGFEKLVKEWFADMSIWGETTDDID